MSYFTLNRTLWKPARHKSLLGNWVKDSSLSKPTRSRYTEQLASLHSASVNITAADACDATATAAGSGGGATVTAGAAGGAATAATAAATAVSSILVYL